METWQQLFSFFFKFASSKMAANMKGEQNLDLNLAAALDLLSMVSAPE